MPRTRATQLELGLAFVADAADLPPSVLEEVRRLLALMLLQTVTSPAKESADEREDPSQPS